MGVRLTHVGGPTVLIELGGWRLLTDPTFDPAGGSYRFGWGTGSRKLAGPALAPEELGEIDAVLLSHDHHDDNLDAAGRALLPRAGTVVTTVPGAKRLGGNARGLAAWETTVLEAEGKTPLEILATPCRHGPPLSHPIVGEVIGFSLRTAPQVPTGRKRDHGSRNRPVDPSGAGVEAPAGKQRADLWISGDTVLYDGVREVGGRLDVDVALLHLGGVRFPISGPLRYTMNAAEAVELTELVAPRVAVPIHYEGWKHFRQGRDEVEAELARAPVATRERFRWLEPGVATDV
jgi:L-ascorbate metabolism protein UlaG (beta-lactamase superfamily)